jgi:hypothetical protein
LLVYCFFFPWAQVLMVYGAERFCSYSGYGSGFQVRKDSLF